jgi:hypothetical protein
VFGVALHDPSLVPRPPSPVKLLVATRNEGKAREIRDLFAGLPFELVFPSDQKFLEPLPDEADVERGDTFIENAGAKARYFARRRCGVRRADPDGPSWERRLRLRSAVLVGRSADDLCRGAARRQATHLASWPRHARADRGIAATAGVGRLEEYGGVAKLLLAVCQRGVAQSGSAPGLGPGGPGFKSRRPDWV